MAKQTETEGDSPLELYERSMKIALQTAARFDPQLRALQTRAKDVESELLALDLKENQGDDKEI